MHDTSAPADPFRTAIIGEAVHVFSAGLDVFVPDGQDQVALLRQLLDSGGAAVSARWDALCCLVHVLGQCVVEGVWSATVVRVV
jgi:hypothetical protein